MTGIPEAVVFLNYLLDWFCLVPNLGFFTWRPVCSLRLGAWPKGAHFLRDSGTDGVRGT